MGFSPDSKLMVQWCCQGKWECSWLLETSAAKAAHGVQAEQAEFGVAVPDSCGDQSFFKSHCRTELSAQWGGVGLAFLS